MSFRYLKPNVSSFGYALFLTINATSIWGGVFPFLPMEFQTPQVTILFFLAQSVSFWGTFLVSMIGSYFFPKATRRMLVFASATPIFVGSASLIAAMYLPSMTFILVLVGGVLLGVGCAGFFILWQRFFASQDAEKGNLSLIIGTGIAAFIYFALYAIPIAVTAFLIPLIFVPLCGLCVTLSSRIMNFDQPMFEDIPKEHPKVYLRAIKDYWRSALCVGALGFTSGVIRAIALTDPTVGHIVNITSMIGAFISSCVLVILWRRFSFHFDMKSAFRFIFPFIVTAFTVLPFLGNQFLDIFAGATYMLFAFATMIMMIQAAQASRDRGINPVFIYGFFGGLVYCLQSLGFISGYFSGIMEHYGLQQLAIVALVSVWFLSITLFIVRGRNKPLKAQPLATADFVEFIALEQPSRSSSKIPDNRENAYTKNQIRTTTESEVVANIDSSISENDPYTRILRDRISKQCAAIQKSFLLSAREAEVMELMARGNSVSHIAESLVVSENTVRTHSKRIYTKLGIHKRQELLALLDDFS